MHTDILNGEDYLIRAQAAVNYNKLASLGATLVRNYDLLTSS